MNILSVGLMALVSMSVLAGCANIRQPAADEASASSSSEPLLGGDQDEFGCIPSAGYQWCEAKQQCLRSWEEACE